MRWLCFGSALAMLAMIGCGGGGGCSPGSTNDCSSGQICTNIQGDGTQCREICQTQSDCPTGQSCEGVANTNTKSCQPAGATATPGPAPTPTPA
jgi:hypothetical protein